MTTADILARLAQVENQLIAEQARSHEMQRQIQESIRVQGVQAQQNNDLNQRLQQATDELVRVSSSRGSGLSDQGVLDPKVLLRPDLFYGSRATYPTWSFVFTSWCGALSQDLLAAMKEAESLKAQRTLATWSPVQQRLPVQLYHMLVTFCRDKALEKLQNIEHNEGLEA